MIKVEIIADMQKTGAFFVIDEKEKSIAHLLECPPKGFKLVTRVANTENWFEHEKIYKSIDEICQAQKWEFGINRIRKPINVKIKPHEQVPNVFNVFNENDHLIATYVNNRRDGKVHKIAKLSSSTFEKIVTLKIYDDLDALVSDQNWNVISQ